MLPYRLSMQIEESRSRKRKQQGQTTCAKTPQAQAPKVSVVLDHGRLANLDKPVPSLTSSRTHQSELAYTWREPIHTRRNGCPIGRAPKILLEEPKSLLFLSILLASSRLGAQGNPRVPWLSMASAIFCRRPLGSLLFTTLLATKTPSVPSVNADVTSSA